MIAMHSVSDSNKLYLFFTLPPDIKRFQNKSSLYLIMSILRHKGQNGLYSNLKKLNLISNIELDENYML